MARLRLLKPYNLQSPGDIVTVTAGVASVLLLQKVGELVSEPQEETPATETSETETTGSEETESGPINTPVIWDAYAELAATAKDAASGLRWALEREAARGDVLDLQAALQQEEIERLEALLADPAVCIVQSDPAVRQQVLDTLEKPAPAESAEATGETPVAIPDPPTTPEISDAPSAVSVVQEPPVQTGSESAATAKPETKGAPRARRS